ncbi:MAG: ATP-grasp domain-containing protein, partial [Thermoanaerobaculia bacterium]|nr:ATP-grasp domain-containing protein [Thermoanaerobaculia bacterium]
MNVLFLSPAYPAEMPWFTRGLAEVGARIVGLGDVPAEALPDEVAGRLADYVRSPRLWDESVTLPLVESLAERIPIDRVECLWEPGMLLAARLRERLGVPGMGVEQTETFRDKEKMKRVLDRAGLRTPRHSTATTAAGCREAAERIGYPLVVKPIAGAGSADTYRVDDPRALEEVLPRLRHVDEVSIEEFVDGEEYTFDTVSIDGEIAYWNVSWYRPRPLVGRSVEWISPQTVALRDVGASELESGVALGRAVLETLGFRTGFSHMEWFLTPDGEAVFGEIGARPPGARSVEIMNYASDLDLYRGWAEAVVEGRFSQPIERIYNAAVVFKRARGRGRIQRVEGLEGLLRAFGRWVTVVDLLPVGAPRRDW